MIPKTMDVVAFDQRNIPILKDYFLSEHEKKQYEKEKHAKAAAHGKPAPKKKAEAQ